MTYLVIVEEGARNFNAYVSDLPGSVASAPSRDQVLEDIKAGIDLHIELMRNRGAAVPEPSPFSIHLVEAA